MAKHVANVTSGNKTSNKIPIKKGRRSIASSRTPYVSMEFPQENFAERFKEDYEFKKRHRHSPRSPVSRFAHAHITAGHEHIGDQECRMVRGDAHGYHAHSTTNTKVGRYRLSGNRKAHQIGKR